MNVYGVVTKWAVKGFVEDWGSEPSLDHGFVQVGLHVESQGFGGRGAVCSRWPVPGAVVWLKCAW